jgi:hypothetical protein
MNKLQYKISEGFDHFKNKALFQVVGINNDYVGEWCTIEKDALKELKDVATS